MHRKPSMIDTHCHIHESDYPLPVDDVIARATADDVTEYICIGTSEESSRRAIAFAKEYDNAYAVVGVHPHDTKDGYEEIAGLADTPGVVGIGEIGLDYFYTHSDRQTQMDAFRAQLKVAEERNLPVSFHVRDAFDDFWPIFESFEEVRGVLHSFTDSPENLEKALKKGLYIGVNGISTFTKDEKQQAMYDSIPLGRLLLETDAPFLTPHPFRGKINEPAYVKLVAEYHAARRGISLEEITVATTANARALFALS